MKVLYQIHFTCKLSVPQNILETYWISINRLIEGNEYQFRVVAINKAGQSKPSEASKNFIAKPRFLAPKIDRRTLRDVTLSAGSTLKLEAAITGEPAPAVEWR